MQLVKHFTQGHKYFLDQNSVLHIADQSGETPFDTDDGDLIVDFSREISALKESPYNSFLIPLKTPDGKETTTPARFCETRWLRDYYNMKLDKSARCRMNAFEDPY